MFLFGNKKNEKLNSRSAENYKIATDLANKFTEKRSEMFSGKYDWYSPERKECAVALNDIIEQIIFCYCKFYNQDLDFESAKVLMDVAESSNHMYEDKLLEDVLREEREKRK